MADQDTDMQPLANGADTAPAVGLVSQYIKDMSFENPNSPAVYQKQTPPAVDVQFNIAAAQVADDLHEVVLKVDVRAEVEGQVAFLVELSYAGLFGFRNVPAEQIQPYLLGEAPRLVFPFCRRVLADAVRDGGFPPLLLEPIDFNTLYLQSQESQAQQGVAGQA